MNESNEIDWRNFTHFEQESMEELENEPDLEKQLIEMKETSGNKLWIMFQTTATAITQLYKDRQSGVSLWVPFQNAAGNVTALYKECGDAQKNLTETGFRCGYQRRNKELLAWLKKRKKHLRREDLIGFLTGKMPPHRTKPIRNSYPYYSHIALPNQETESNTIDESDPEFIETLPNFNCNLSNIKQQTPGHRSRNFVSELNNYSSITEEYAQNVESRKRLTSSDVIMDSPTHKRSRYT